MYRRSFLSRMLVSLLPLLLLVMLGDAGTALAQEYGSRNRGQHVYDRAGALSSAEIGELELHAEMVERAGAPVVVYLQTRDADYDETEDDARNLMATWDVQSSTDARDGFVIFLNIDPDDKQHGQVALFAGQTHYDDGRLPEYELRRIFEDVMLPSLVDGQLAEGIRAGLNAASDSLTLGPPPPPPPSAAEQTVAALAREPLAVLSLLALSSVALVVIRSHRTRPKSHGIVAAIADPPGDLAPASVGALVRRHVGHEQAEATILELARRGALVLEPSGREKKVQVRLIDARVPHGDYEQHIWRALSGSAAEQDVVSDERVGKILVGEVRKSADEALRAELRDRGWYDSRVGARRRPLITAGVAALLVAVAGFVAAIVGDELLSLVWVGLLFAAGIVSLAFAAELPETTQAGEDAAAPWHAYLAGLESAREDDDSSANLDDAVPYAVATGATGALKKRLEAASDRGYSPLWFGRSKSSQDWSGGFYPYWIWFHTSITPAGASGGNAVGGGASVGGGGAGGRF
ncbi:MAG: DUF2207 domain-containing protein [Chloroflexi bacterium]|nr:DUF2207 domain-containing protein [Chloroflexota bacterium]